MHISSNVMWATADRMYQSKHMRASLFFRFLLFVPSIHACRTKDILHVKERLGHKSITNTLIYTHLVDFGDDEYHTATASTLKEDDELLRVGFECVTERDGVKIYRKRK
jgi:hypothetical protein